MNLIKKVIVFLKNLFQENNDIKMLNAQIEYSNNNKENFINSMQLNITPKKKKKKVETLTCFGDGLGIQNKITY